MRKNGEEYKALVYTAISPESAKALLADEHVLQATKDLIIRAKDLREAPWFWDYLEGGSKHTEYIYDIVPEAEEEVLRLCAEAACKRDEFQYPQSCRRTSKEEQEYKTLVYTALHGRSANNLLANTYVAQTTKDLILQARDEKEAPWFWDYLEGGSKHTEYIENIVPAAKKEVLRLYRHADVARKKHSQQQSPRHQRMGKDGQEYKTLMYTAINPKSANNLLKNNRVNQATKNLIQQARDLKRTSWFEDYLEGGSEHADYVEHVIPAAKEEVLRIYAYVDVARKKDARRQREAAKALKHVEAEKRAAKIERRIAKRKRKNEEAQMYAHAA